jgi:uncharacterized protein (TIGR00725 family)
MTARLPIVGVMGSGENEWPERSEPLGRFLAERPVHLLTGGGRGVMAAVSRAFSQVPDREGLVLGVLPCRADDPLCRPRDGYPNPHVELAIRTHLPLSGVEGASILSRNHINVLTSDAVIALPGGDGTLSEVLLALRYERQVAAYIEAPGELPGLPAEVRTVRSLAEVDEFLRAAMSGVTSA